MRRHLGRREREARKRRRKHGKHYHAMQDRYGMITLKIGRKKSSEIGFRNKTTLQLKKRFSGCVVDAEK